MSNFLSSTSLKCFKTQIVRVHCFCEHSQLSAWIHVELFTASSAICILQDNLSVPNTCSISLATYASGAISSNFQQKITQRLLLNITVRVFRLLHAPSNTKHLIIYQIQTYYNNTWTSELLQTGIDLQKLAPSHTACIYRNGKSKALVHINRFKFNHDQNSEQVSSMKLHCLTS